MENTQRPYEPSCEAIYCEYEQDAYDAGSLHERHLIVRWIRDSYGDIEVTRRNRHGQEYETFLSNLIESGEHHIKD